MRLILLYITNDALLAILNLKRQICQWVYYINSELPQFELNMLCCQYACLYNLILISGVCRHHDKSKGRSRSTI